MKALKAALAITIVMSLIACDGESTADRLNAEPQAKGSRAVAGRYYNPLIQSADAGNFASESLRTINIDGSYEILTVFNGEVEVVRGTYRVEEDKNLIVFFGPAVIARCGSSVDDEEAADFTAGYQRTQEGLILSAGAESHLMKEATDAEVEKIEKRYKSD